MSQRTSPIQVLFRTFATNFGGLLVIAGILVVGGVLSTPLTSLSFLLFTAQTFTGTFRIVVNSPDYGYGPDASVGVVMADFKKLREKK